MAARKRIAFIVYNDVYRDSRVLKTADSAADAGYEARIFAVGGPLSHYPAGLSRRRSGAEILRIGVLPDRFPLASRVLARRRERLAAARQRAADAAASAAATAGEAPATPARRSAPPRPPMAARMTARAMRWLLALRLRDFERRAAKAVAQWRPDLVHAHDANTLTVAMRVQRRRGTPFVYDAHELWEERNAQRGERARRAERKLLDRATALMAGSVTVSPGIQDWMTERYDLSEPPVLVRNIPRAPTRAHDASAGSLRERAGLTEESRVAVYVGGITTGRGIDEAIEAIAQLPDDVHLVLLGQGSPENIAFFGALAVRLGVADRVHFAGSVESDSVSAAIADADVSLVYTQPKNLSYRLSLPNKLFESVHAGLPVVASDLPDVRALVEQYGFGELCEPDDVASLAEAVERVVAHSDDLRAAAAAAASSLSWENEMERLFALYQSILESSSSGVVG